MHMGNFRRVFPLASMFCAAGALFSLIAYAPTPAFAIPVPVDPATYVPAPGETPVDFTDARFVAALSALNADVKRKTEWSSESSPIQKGHNGPSGGTSRPRAVIRDGQIQVKLDGHWIWGYLDLVGQATQTFSLQVRRLGSHRSFRKVGQSTKWAYGLREALGTYIDKGYFNAIYYVTLKETPVDLQTFREYEYRVLASYRWRLNKAQTHERYFTVNKVGQDEYTESLPTDGRYIPEMYRGNSFKRSSRVRSVKSLLTARR